jgi:hypothetical protein
MAKPGRMLPFHEARLAIKNENQCQEKILNNQGLNNKKKCGILRAAHKGIMKVK